MLVQQDFFSVGPQGNFSVDHWTVPSPAPMIPPPLGLPNLGGPGGPSWGFLPGPSGIPWTFLGGPGGVPESASFNGISIRMRRSSDTTSAHVCIAAATRSHDVHHKIERPPSPTRISKSFSSVAERWYWSNGRWRLESWLSGTPTRMRGVLNVRVPVFRDSNPNARGSKC